MRIFFTSKRSISMFALLVIGILFLILPSKYVYPIVLCLIGSVVCLDGIVKLTFLNRYHLGDTEFRFDLWEGITCLIIGIVVFKFHEYRYVTFTCGILLAIAPLLRIVFSNHKFNQFVVDIPKFVGIVVLISSIDRIITVRIVASALFLSIAVIIFITLIYKIRRGDVKDEIEN